MKEIFKTILYKLLSIQERVLSTRLDKSLKKSYKNKTTKTILSSTEHMTLNSETEKTLEFVRKNVEDLVKNTTFEKLLEYIQASGTKVCRLKNADTILKTIGEEEGLVCELEGLKALYINLITDSGFKLKSKPLLILNENKLEPLYILHHFYKWYALKSNLPGFDINSQKNFKKYLKNVQDESISRLSINDILDLKEAIARDQEATDFVLSFVKKTEGGKKAHKKITEGGANI